MKKYLVSEIVETYNPTTNVIDKMLIPLTIFDKKQEAHAYVKNYSQQHNNDDVIKAATYGKLTVTEVVSNAISRPETLPNYSKGE